MTIFQQPVCLNDFALKPQTRSSIELILKGVDEIPRHGVSGILLWGTYGSGKTTLANLLPNWIEGVKSDLDAMKVNCGESAGVDVCSVSDILTIRCGQAANGVQVMTSLNQFAQTMSLSTKSHLKFVILDEFDHLTDAAMASFKALMSSTTRIVFIMTTNHYNQIDEGVLDRSIVLDMNEAPRDAWRDKLKRDYARANEHFEWESLQAVVEQGRGSCRRILSDLDRVVRSRNAA